MRKIIITAVFSALVITLYACGGGGGSTPATTPNPIQQISGFNQTYTSSLSMGEVVNMTVDTSNNSFNYTVIKSQYGCEIMSAQCHSDSGSISKDPDGTYSGTGVIQTLNFLRFKMALLLASCSLLASLKFKLWELQTH